MLSLFLSIILCSVYSADIYSSNSEKLINPSAPQEGHGNFSDQCMQNDEILIAQGFAVIENGDTSSEVSQLQALRNNAIKDQDACCCISRDSYSAEFSKYPRVYTCCIGSFTNPCVRPIANVCLEPSAKADCLVNFTYKVIFPLVLCCAIKDSCCGDNK